MQKVKISIIAALGVRTRAIGLRGSLLWRLPGDLPRFKTLTTGHPVIMGRKTYESIGKALPGRTNIIISHNPESQAKDTTPLSGPSAKWVGSLPEALAVARESVGSDEVFIIGGGEIYKQAISLADRLYLTLVDSDLEGDTFFPPYPYFQTKLHEEESPKPSNEIGQSDPLYKFVILER